MDANILMAAQKVLALSGALLAPGGEISLTKVIEIPDPKHPEKKVPVIVGSDGKGKNADGTPMDQSIQQMITVQAAQHWGIGEVGTGV
ncbi:hypothetical protein, partial [Burkholderia sp. RS02]|uniref:hypothetical protein n=1 Tax=unclassified Burkholderia TaxID=2613784 RepID=UPI003218DCE4